MAITFGGQTLTVEDIPVSQKPHRTKQTLGKRVTMHEIIGADSMDIMLDIRGYINAASRAALITARNALEDLDDGSKHAYANSNDSRYDDDYVIETGSLSWETNINPNFIRYSLRLIKW